MLHGALQAVICDDTDENFNNRRRLGVLMTEELPWVCIMCPILDKCLVLS
jgi:hypothetical protein